MSGFWSGWIMALVVINYVTIFFLFLWAPKVQIPTEEDGTTGHSWAHGEIKEGLHPLPKWWLIMSTLSFIAAFIYLTQYPGFGSYKGSQNWTSYGQLQDEVAGQNARMTTLLDDIRSESVLALSKNPEAMQLGRRLFGDNCAACHGYDAKGNHVVGAPNLTDNTWLYGGKSTDVINSITNGRSGTMPSWSALGEESVNNAAHYVLSLSGLDQDAKAAAAGKEVFAGTCAACHGQDAKGNPMLGAPNLTDGDWLYGSSFETVHHSIDKGLQGVMPAWSSRLNQDQIKVLAAWVLSHDNTEQAVAAGEQ